MNNASTSFVTPTPTLEPIYPNSKVISSDSISLILENTDNVAVITNWYKEQIQNEGMHTTSFVQTRTNGNVLNRLVGSNSYRKIDVEIRKKSNQSKVRITIYVN